ncbi:hypothetical protein C1H46_021493 [Malus baccata]|uniref:Exportin-5 C-terminal domain-containing protein n=1 Tax=Malus baccata TaxID=106549 RepID=A0A540M2N7_MALBA|nr:hypothetical protein C1H46_021493 [Malus baccata]
MIKNGDVRILANTAFLLVKKNWSSEIRLHAFKMLQHLVRLRWEELSSTERRNFANITVDLILQVLMVRREELNLWCGFLLSSPDFRLHACEFFKLVSQRKRPIDDTYAPEFDSAMSNIFQIVMNVSKEFLYRSSPGAGVIDESDIEFAEYICESMLSLGSTNLHCIAGDSAVLPLYLQQVTRASGFWGFFQHFKAALHLQSLTIWLALMRDLMSKPKAVAHSAGDGSDPVDIKKRKILIFLNDDICSAILDVSFQHMLKREKVIHGTAFSLGQLELWSDDVEDKGTFGQYRSKLDVVVMENMQSALENVVSTIFDGSNEIAGGHSEAQLELCIIFEGLF